MRAVLFGATGMVGQCVLRECLQDAEKAYLTLVLPHPNLWQDIACPSTGHGLNG